MHTTCIAAQVPPELECERLSTRAVLPRGQHIGTLSFTGAQQQVHAAKGRARLQKSRQHFTLKVIETNDLPQPRDETCPRSPNSVNQAMKGTNPMSEAGGDIARDEEWQECEIPSELEWIHPDTPEEIRNIIQESIDEQCALRASRLSATQAIVVRTTITQSRTSYKDISSPISSKSSATASIRRAGSSIFSDVASSRSVGVESTTSLGSEKGSEKGYRSTSSPSMHSQTTSSNSDDELSETSSLGASIRKTMKERGVFRYLARGKGGTKSPGPHNQTHSNTASLEDVQGRKTPVPSYRLRRRSDTFEEEVRMEEAEIKAAISAVEAAERTERIRREAEEARRATAQEHERMAGITEFFEYLRDILENVRLQQKQAIQKRHKREISELEDRERALVSGEQILDQEQNVAAERAGLVMQTQEIIKSARKKHANQLLETIGRHRKDQDAYLIKSNEAMERHLEVDQHYVLDQLLQAQNLERSTLRWQQKREVQKLQKRADLMLQDFDNETETARMERLQVQVQEADKVTRTRAALKKQADADWRWFEAISRDRAVMLGEDEQRMILSGAGAPMLHSISVFG